MSCRSAAAFVFIFIFASMSGHHVAKADDAADLARLKAENARLSTELDAANKKIEKLENTIESMRARKDKETDQKEEDLFIVGSRWSGSRFYNQNGKPANRKSQPWTMTITERDGKKFKADITFNAFDGLDKEITVSGTAPLTGKGQVVFKTDQKGIFQQTFKGALSGEQVSLTFSGTGVEGTPVNGTGDLKR